MKVRIELEGEPYDVEIERNAGGLRVSCEGEETDVRILGRAGTVQVAIGKDVHAVDVRSDEEAVIDGTRLRFHVARFEPGNPAHAGGVHAAVHAVMPGRIVRVLVERGATVQKGDALLVLEAMKMQNELASPIEGRVAEVLAAEGDVVEAGRVLLRLELA